MTQIKSIRSGPRERSVAVYPARTQPLTVRPMQSGAIWLRVRALVTPRHTTEVRNRVIIISAVMAAAVWAGS